MAQSQGTKSVHNTPLALKINCGYFRTAIRELIPKQKGIYGRSFNEQTLIVELGKLFSVPGYGFEGLQSCYKFGMKCNEVLNAFTKKWHPKSARTEYESEFATCKWKALPDEVKNQHTLSNCSACYHKYESLQTAFPMRPVYVAPTTTCASSLVTFPTAEASPKKVAQQVLSELNTQWKAQYNTTFTKSLPTLAPELNLVERLSKTDKKKEDRRKKRMLVTHINKQLGENATLSVLAEGESLSAYRRKRLSMSFENLETPAKRQKSHSPKDDSIKWNVQGAVESLTHFPSEETINWTAVARCYGGTEPNAGQVLKEIAFKHGIDIQQLEHKEHVLPRIRNRKKEASRR